MDNIPKPRPSCSWTYKINKLLVSPNERLNNVILERTVEYHTYPVSKFHGKRIQRFLWDREHNERKIKLYMACSHAHIFVTFVITCLSYGTILVSLQECGFSRIQSYTGQPTLQSHRPKLGSTSSNAIIHPIFSLERNWSKHVPWPNIPLLCNNQINVAPNDVWVKWIL